VLDKNAYLKAAQHHARRAGAGLLSMRSPHSILSFLSVGSILSAGSILGLGSAVYSPSRGREDHEES
jgi:hypothetical protein